MNVFVRYGGLKYVRMRNIVGVDGECHVHSSVSIAISVSE